MHLPPKVLRASGYEASPLPVNRWHAPHYGVHLPAYAPFNLGVSRTFQLAFVKDLTARLGYFVGLTTAL
jgi:hypothetical protein